MSLAQGENGVMKHMKRKTIFLRNLLLAVTVLTFLMGVQMSSYVAAAEATSYIPTWKEYTESGQPSATWNDVANAMDALLDAGKAIYASGDADGARKNVNDWPDAPSVCCLLPPAR